MALFSQYQRAQGLKKRQNTRHLASRKNGDDDVWRASPTPRSISSALVPKQILRTDYLPVT